MRDLLKRVYIAFVGDQRKENLRREGIDLDTSEP